ncbi:hypothetical protein SAE01_42020 [Segetibacter aerophilus]|uniref:Uncharacterized protein n=2 Tax=Segetibacter aerophilus TaxID=670293 RepID=A0A512BIB0_9BACT|nr:hypothetical protein SAE01_42020 [Segetibacter aerophilus]
MLLRDEGLSQLSFIDIANPTANWFVSVPAGRDIQLVGDNRVLIGTGKGYEERQTSTGSKVYEDTSFAGTITARRLRNGNTLLGGLNWQGKQGIVLIEINRTGKTLRTIVYPGFDYLRLVRETASGTFMVTSNNVVFEGNDKGEIIWKAAVTGLPQPHAWQAVRLSNGQTVVSSGYAKNFQIVGKDGKLLDTITGPAEVHPHFYAGFQILANGNYVVANWQGHGVKQGGSGTQILEYTPKGKLVWSWKQDPAKFSSIQGVIVLDELDLSRLYVEDANGKLAPTRLKQ